MFHTNGIPLIVDSRGLRGIVHALWEDPHSFQYENANVYNDLFSRTLDIQHGLGGFNENKNDGEAERCQQNQRQTEKKIKAYKRKKNPARKRYFIIFSLMEK